MNFIRNLEVKKQLALYSIFSLVIFLGALFINIICAIYVLGTCIISECIFLFFTYRRYNDIAELSYQIEKILHSNEYLDFIVNNEGELAILSNMIYKLTIRLREQAERLEKEKNYLKNFIEDISHQIRTPMTSIQIILSRLSKEDISQNEKFELTKEISSLLSRIEWLITAILEVAQLESDTITLKKENINVQELIKQVLDTLNIQLEVKDISVKLRIEENANYQGDFYWSTEAIQNILKNSIEHSNNGGIVEIIAKRNPIYTEISIMDNGKGIDEKDLPHLFERFYKGKNSTKQSIGIGLFLSKTIINKQNGYILAKNRNTRRSRI